MLSPIKTLKERFERLINLEPYNTIRMKLMLDKAIDELNLIVADEMKNLDDIETKIIMQEGKIIIKRFWNDLSEFEMNELETEINTEIEILKNEEKKIRNTIDCLKKSKPEYFYTKKKRDITDYFKKTEYEYKKCRSVKKLEKELEK